MFLKYVNKAFDALELGKREMQQSLKNKNETIIMSTSSIHFLTHLITSFLHEYPHIKFSQTLDSNNIIKEQLLQKRIDCCITSPLIEDDGIETIEIANEEILLCVPNTHKFASATSLYLKHLENEDFILLSEKYSFRQLIDEWCSTNHVSLNVLFECDFSLAVDLMNLKKGISLLPQSLCKKFVHSDIVFIHLSDTNHFRKIGFSKLKEHHTVSLDLFQDFVIAYFKEHY
ncbi:MAG: LysR family transcriptional regulator substrate-binding protein [Cellulosilyticaceae bacterium]